VIEIILNRNPDEAGASTRIEQAVRTLSQIYGEAFEATAAKIRMLDYDVIKAILPDRTVFRDSIRFRLGERFLSGLRRLLTSTAIAQHTGSTHFIQSDLKGLEFVGNCRLGHTFRGSFGFTIESPVGPRGYPDDEFPHGPAPFERRVVERLAVGLRAVETSVRTDDIRAIESQLTSGANVNMLDDLSTLIQHTEGAELKFSFAFSDAWQSNLDQTTQATILPRAIDFTQELVRRYRLQEKASTVTLVGHVYRLEARGDPSDLFNEQTTRDASIEVAGGEYEGKTFRLRLPPDDYISAIHAHESGKVVVVEGSLEQNSRGYSLSRVQNFRVL
jgi:hypothetical protein